MDQAQYDALVSLAYNGGEGNVRALAPYINTGDLVSAANYFYTFQMDASENESIPILKDR